MNELMNNLRREADIYLQSAINYFVASIPQFNENLGDVRRRLIESCDYLALLIFSPLQNDEQKIALLKELFPYAVGNGGSRTEQLAENILNSLALSRDDISRSVHPLVAFNTHFRKKYAAILEKHTKPPGITMPSELREWLRDNEVRKQCILLFHDKPELLMYLDEIDIVNTIARYEDSTELREAVQQIPGAGARDKINACGIIVACDSENSQLAQYFFSELEMSDDYLFIHAQALCGIHSYAVKDLGYMTKIFQEQAGTASDEAIKKMYSWCFNSKGVYCVYPNAQVMGFIQMTCRKVGLDFVFDEVMRMKDFDQMEESLGQNMEDSVYTVICRVLRCLYVCFYKDLLEWMQAEDIELRQDVYGLVKDYIELMDRESQVEGSRYFRNKLPDFGVEEFRGELVELKGLIEGARRSSDSDNTGPEHGDAASPTFGAGGDTQ